MRLGVAERTLLRRQGGACALPPPNSSACAALAASRRADSFAICLLHSYANPASEQRLARALRPMGLPLSVSHRILAEYREFERLSTTVVNAYVAPRMSSHLGRLERDLRAGASARDAIQRQRDRRAACARRTGPHDPLRPRRRRDRRGRAGAAQSASIASSLSTWAALRPTFRCSTGRAAHPHAQLSRRLRRAHSRHRHPHRGRGRRLDCARRCGRLAQGRSRKRRRGSGSSLLWTRRRADRHRRRPGRGAPDGGEFSRRRDAPFSRRARRKRDRPRSAVRCAPTRPARPAA